jgi:hypothetical protein
MMLTILKRRQLLGKMLMKSPKSPLWYRPATATVVGMRKPAKQTPKLFQLAEPSSLLMRAVTTAIFLEL